MANKRIYRLSPLAEQDLEDIWLYTLREWSADQADRYYHSIISAMKACLPAGISHSQLIFFPATGSLRLADTSSILKNTMTIST